MRNYGKNDESEMELSIFLSFRIVNQLIIEVVFVLV
jgi:hypothetical protein